MKKTVLACILICSFTVFCFSQEEQTANSKPWEEMIYRTETGTIPDTSRTYSISIRYSPYSDQAYITYIILDGLYHESDAVYAVRDVARRFLTEFGYDWYSYASPAILWYDNVKHIAYYRANVQFRKYLIQKED